jgi:peptide methionine sulfoxide reductase MsrB
MMNGEDIPSEACIRRWKAVQPFMIEPRQLTGIYRNREIDAIIFHYSTNAATEQFWASLQSNIQETKWRIVTETPETREYERQFSKGEISPERSDMAIFSSAEKLKIDYLASMGMAIVAYVQADSSAAHIGFDDTREARWAAEELWPRFNTALNQLHAD